ncbi:MAG TPA: hypothetical protein DD729_00070 [Rhodobacteraceae bacterium]|jgi:hypothetical protein|nr:hypothetical protein [Paracoccaceae bacterium]
MGFVRPQSKAQIWRWREVFLGLAVVLWGGWLALTGTGFIAWIGWALLVAGGLWMFAGVQRARFRVGTGGAGTVQVDEREVIYFGPLEGGSVSIEAMIRVELVPAKSGVHRWVLLEPGRNPLSIPIDADHVDDLFDAFEALHGFEMQAALAALNRLSSDPVVIWQKRTVALH